MTKSVAPDVIGTVRGYRTWSVTKDKNETWRLQSRSRYHNWNAGENRAECFGNYSHCHRGDFVLQRWPGRGRPDVRWKTYIEGSIPGEHCTCGLYAARSPWSSQIMMSASAAFGVIECSGAIVPHEENTVIRAAKATIKAVALPGSKWRSRKALQETYPDVKFYRSKYKMLRDFPPQGIRLPDIPRRKIWRSASMIPAYFVMLMSLANLAVAGLDPWLFHAAPYVNIGSGLVSLGWFFILARVIYSRKENALLAKSEDEITVEPLGGLSEDS